MKEVSSSTSHKKHRVSGLHDFSLIISSIFVNKMIKLSMNADIVKILMKGN